jgi:hypothetical protein
MFCIVFLVLNVTSICVLKRFVIFFVSFRLYVKIAYFDFWCCIHMFLCCFKCLTLKFDYFHCYITCLVKYLVPFFLLSLLFGKDALCSLGNWCLLFYVRMGGMSHLGL